MKNLKFLFIYFWIFILGKSCSPGHMSFHHQSTDTIFEPPSSDFPNLFLSPKSTDCSAQEAKDLWWPGIQSVIHGGLLKVEVKKIYKGLESEEGVKKSWIRSPEPLYVCSSEAPAEGSLEEIAFTVSNYLSEAHRFYGSIPHPDLLPLPLLEIHLQPVIEKTIKNAQGEVTFYDMDNASWDYSKSQGLDSYGITILPQSDNLRRNQIPPLWSSRFTIFHEFGHHIFHQYLQDRSSSLLEIEGDSTFSTFALDALHEMIADIFASLAIGRQNLSAELAPFESFRENRDVFSEYFSDGSAKVVNQDRMLYSLVRLNSVAIFPYAKVLVPAQFWAFPNPTLGKKGYDLASIFSHIFMGLADLSHGKSDDLSKHAENFVHLMVAARYILDETDHFKFFHRLFVNMISITGIHPDRKEETCSFIDKKLPFFVKFWKQDENLFPLWQENCAAVNHL